MPKNCLILAAMLSGLFTAATIAAPVDFAIDLDTRFLFSADPGPEPTEVATQPGFSSWDLIDQYPPGATLTEQDVTFNVTGWLGSLGPGPNIATSIGGARLRSPALGGGGGGGAFDPLLRDFVWVSSLVPFETGREGPLYRALLLTVARLTPGKYQMTSWHYDSLIEPLGNRIRIAIGNSIQGGEIVEESFPLGTTPATYTFDVTEVGQTKYIYYLITDAINPEGPGREFNTRLNGFTLLSVPEPSTLAMLTVCVAIMVGGCRGLRAKSHLL